MVCCYFCFKTRVVIYKMKRERETKIELVTESRESSRILNVQRWNASLDEKTHTHTQHKMIFRNWFVSLIRLRHFELHPVPYTWSDLFSYNDDIRFSILKKQTRFARWQLINVRVCVKPLLLCTASWLKCPFIWAIERVNWNILHVDHVRRIE